MSQHLTTPPTPTLWPLFRSLRGYEAAYLSKSGTPTTLNGSLTVLSGATATKTVVVKGKLAVQGGSLRVNDVRVHP